MKKRILSLFLCICLLIGILQTPTNAIVNLAVKMPNGEPVFFTVVNDVLQELKYNMIPIVRNGKYYIPYSILTNNFNIRSAYSSSEKVLYLSNMRDNIKFDINAGCAYDKNGKIDEPAYISKGQVFVPLDFICKYLGLTYALISEGPIIRIKDENNFYPNQFLSILFKNRMQEMLTEFLASLEEQPDDPLPPSPPPPPPIVEEPVTVYLTFDDGPSKYTDKIIDILAEAGCHATFFLIGESVAANESSVRKLYITGNEIGLHSYNHSKDTFYRSTASMLRELSKTNALIKRILQTESRLVRIPFGSGEPEFTSAFDEALTNAGYRYWDWTIHANDIGEDISPDSILTSIITQLEESERDTEVIIMHETESTVEMLPSLLAYLSENNFEIELISPLDEPINTRNQ